MRTICLHLVREELLGEDWIDSHILPQGKGIISEHPILLEVCMALQVIQSLTN